jgi:phenylalanyl-tRNA synthetase alpha chain
MSSYLSPSALSAALNLRDLTDPSQGSHAMQALLDAVLDRLSEMWRVPVDVRRDPALVAVADNYDNLGYESSAITRDQRYSRYVGPTVMLRSHTSAGVPLALRSMAALAQDDRLLVLPGLVYRRDVIDRVHVGAPHQVDLWRIRSAPLGVGDLMEMVASIVETVLPGAAWRAVPACHPYTLQGCQVDVEVEGTWLELVECGLVAPHVLTRAGLDHARWSGLALGMGLDRALMLRKNLPDIRLLRASDPRIASQLLDLSPWRPVSGLPPVRRDLSLVVDAPIEAETLGDRVRAALGNRSDDVESVTLLQVTPYEQLPPQARDRLGLGVDQVNALVRIVLRPLDRTLTDDEANRLRDDVYRALHQGPVPELINGQR